MGTLIEYAVPESLRPYYEWYERITELFPDYDYYERGFTLCCVHRDFWVRMRESFRIPGMRTRIRGTVVSIDLRKVLSPQQGYELRRVIHAMLIKQPKGVETRVRFVPDTEYYTIPSWQQKWWYEPARPVPTTGLFWYKEESNKQ